MQSGQFTEAATSPACQVATPCGSLAREQLDWLAGAEHAAEEHGNCKEAAVAAAVPQELPAATVPKSTVLHPATAGSPAADRPLAMTAQGSISPAMQTPLTSPTLPIQHLKKTQQVGSTMQITTRAAPARTRREVCGERVLDASKDVGLWALEVSSVPRQRALKSAQDAGEWALEASKEAGRLALERGSAMGERALEASKEVGHSAMQRSALAGEQALEASKEMGRLALERGTVAAKEVSQLALQKGSEAADRALDASKEAGLVALEMGTMAAERALQASKAALQLALDKGFVLAQDAARWAQETGSVWTQKALVASASLAHEALEAASTSAQAGAEAARVSSKKVDTALHAFLDRLQGQLEELFEESDTDDEDSGSEAGDATEGVGQMSEQRNRVAPGLASSPPHVQALQMKWHGQGQRVVHVAPPRVLCAQGQTAHGQHPVFLQPGLQLATMRVVQPATRLVSMPPTVYSPVFMQDTGRAH